MQMSFEDPTSAEEMAIESNAVPGPGGAGLRFARVHHVRQKGIGCILENMHFELSVASLCSLLNFPSILLLESRRWG